MAGRCMGQLGRQSWMRGGAQGSWEGEIECVEARGGAGRAGSVAGRCVGQLGGQDRVRGGTRGAGRAGSVAW